MVPILGPMMEGGICLSELLSTCNDFLKITTSFVTVTLKTSFTTISLV